MEGLNADRFVVSWPPLQSLLTSGAARPAVEVIMANRDIALALSGGGYRAALFHLGVLKELFELNLLDRIAVISSVSGGSIVAGAYACSLVRNQGFENFLSTTTRFLQRRALDWPALLWEVLPWQASARRIERAFDELFSNDGRSWLSGPPRGRVRKLHYLRRQLDIMGHHNNRITVALALQLHRTRATSTKGMAMLRIDEPVVERTEQAGTVAALTRVPTRLKWPPSNTAGKLTDHGANLLWARLSEYTDRS
jgi:hypothetical protein